MTNPTLISTPFAQNGDKSVIQETTGSEPNSATWEAGFPLITSEPISTGGLPPKRVDFNGALNAITDNIVHQSKGVMYEFDAAYAAKIGGYPLNARLVLTTGEIVRNTLESNINDPNIDMTGWVKDLSANQIEDSRGVTQQDINDNFVTPEMFGAVANNTLFDNTSALNAAFATGKNVYSTPDKTYTCNGNIKTLGQLCVGGWKIRTEKPVVGLANWINTTTTKQIPTDKNFMQGIYVAYAYDLAELFAIRELGYNTLLHYGGMHISGYDDDGTVTDLLNNAKTAGLQVFLGTQNSLNGMTLADFVNQHKDHPALLGFLIADEPTHNGVTVAQQATNIATMRSLTNKALACTDFTYDAFTEVLASGYDYIFGDIYNDTGSTIEQTLYKMRAWLGLTTKRHPGSKVLPAVMGFKYSSGAPISDIVQTSKVFAKSCGGNFACFVWDGGGEPSISNSIRDTVELQTLSKEICGFKSGIFKIPECYAWGTLSSATTQIPYGLHDPLKHIIRADPYTASGFEGVNCYPAQMNGGATDGDRTSSYISTGVGLAAIWFKGSFGAYVSDINMKQYNSMTVQSGMLAKGAADVIIAVRGSSEGGYGLGSTLATLPNNESIGTVTFENSSKTDVFCIKYDSSVSPTNYRTFVRGVYITSDW